MIPFRPTMERVHYAIRDLRSDRRDERGYQLTIGYDLYCDMVTDKDLWGWLEPAGPGRLTMLGLPVKVDHSIKRGYIHLRHEVIA